MKWNDIVNHMKKNSGPAVMPTPVAVTPVSSPASSVPARPPASFKWLPITMIFLVIIVAAIIIYLIIYTHRNGVSRFTPADAVVVTEFFDNNPPAQITAEDMQYINSVTGSQSDQ